MILPFSHGDMGAAGGDPGGGESPMDPRTNRASVETPLMRVQDKWHENQSKLPKVARSDGMMSMS